MVLSDADNDDLIGIIARLIVLGVSLAVKLKGLPFALVRLRNNKLVVQDVTNEHVPRGMSDHEGELGLA